MVTTKHQLYATNGLFRSVKETENLTSSTAIAQNVNNIIDVI